MCVERQNKAKSDHGVTQVESITENTEWLKSGGMSGDHLLQLPAQRGSPTAGSARPSVVEF